VTANHESIIWESLESLLDDIVNCTSLEGSSREEHSGMNEVRTVRVSFGNWHRFVIASEID
jgi:hypothetical protein